MTPFGYIRAGDAAQAVAALRQPGAQLIAGGTTLVDLMRLGVMQPRAIVDMTALPLRDITVSVGAGALGALGARLGALATNADVADHAELERGWPALAEALNAGASPQIRNMATVGGNLLQRTRCPYFRDTQAACNKRQPGAGCDGIGGVGRSLAVLGTSQKCIATHPSDMCVALVALDAIVHVQGPSGERTIPIADFHTVPGDHPEIESQLAAGELVTSVELPARAFARTSRYVKVRDRAQYAFALASAAVALEITGGVIRDARIALGGVATKPWRPTDAEHALIGAKPSRAAFERAGQLAMQGARTQRDNAFKVELGQRTVVRALELVAGGAA